MLELERDLPATFVGWRGSCRDVGGGRHGAMEPSIVDRQPASLAQAQIGPLVVKFD
jgi:hypothetical protein